MRQKNVNINSNNKKHISHQKPFAVKANTTVSRNEIQKGRPPRRVSPLTNAGGGGVALTPAPGT
jgi:hypothetical protein